jgi:hypothetical protein
MRHRPILWHSVGAAVLGAALLSGCTSPGPPDTGGLGPMEGVIARLQTPDDAVRRRAAQDLREMAYLGLSAEDGVKALDAAATASFPGERGPRIRAVLVTAAAFDPKPEYVPVVDRNFALYDRATKDVALKLLLNLRTRPAAEAYVNQLSRATAALEVDAFSIAPLVAAPHDLDVFFPRLLDCARDRATERQVYAAALEFARRGLFAEAALSETGGRAMLKCASLRRSLMPTQQAAGVGWMWEPKYLHDAQLAQPVIELLGYCPAAGVEQELRACLLFGDKRLKSAAILSLLRLGLPVETTDLRDVAAAPVARADFYRGLQEQGRLDHYPADLRNAQDFAEAEMVEWLAASSDWGRPPDEVRLSGIITRATDEGNVSYYVFKFRNAGPDARKPAPWLAGVAGPFQVGVAAGPADTRETFSAFEPFDKRTDEGHVEHTRAAVGAEK